MALFLRRVLLLVSSLVYIRAADPWEDGFLPTNIQPVHYDLWMYPDFYFDGNTFQGRVTMEIDILDNTTYLIVHQKMMTITKTEVKTSGGQDITVVTAFAYDPNQFWVVETVSPMSQGTRVFLTLEFTGSLVNGIVGYYKSTYVNSLTGVESWLATTKFQPTEARKAFPHFDEPRFKAEFTITLRHWQNFTGISNMPVESTLDTDGTWRETTFQRSVPMSSYLVCFIVTDFLYKNNTFGGGRFREIPHRVWARPDLIDQVDYALSTGALLMDWLMSEMDMEYHLPKLDQVAVPDYPSGATEHWGIITYRERSLLFDPNQASTSDKQSLSSTLAHELSHNYFGDPLTCYWWDEIWLNEGFATYWTRPSLDGVISDFEMLNQFVSSTFQGAMVTDSSATSRPMIQPITNPDQANAAFDSISYNKGASMLYMMQGFLGYDVFIKGNRQYLIDFNLKSVTTPDFINSMQKEIEAAGMGLDLTEIMDTWLMQMGYPVIDVEINGEQLQARQSRFLADPDADPQLPASPHGYKWHVYLDYHTRDGKTGSRWMNVADVSFPNPTSPGEWIKFNINETGFYRVNYSPELWSLLATQLNNDFKVLNEKDRSNLLDDAFNLAKAGRLGYPFALDLTIYLKGEDHYVPWRSARVGLDYIGNMLYGTKEYKLWRAYVVDITKSSMERLQVADYGTHLEKLNRLDIMSLACAHGNSGCLLNATRLFYAWIQDEVGGSVPTNIRSRVYQFGLEQTDGDVVWNTMWERYTKATSAQEQSILMYALSRTNRIWLVKKLLSYAMDESKIRQQDFYTCINNLSANRNANPIVWRWARKNYDQLIDRFGIEDRYFAAIVPNIVYYYNTEYKLKEVQDFYAKYPDAGPGAANRANSIANIEANISWMKRNEREISNWLQENINI